MKNENSATAFVMKSEGDKRWYRENGDNIKTRGIQVRVYLQLDRYYKRRMDTRAMKALKFGNVKFLDKSSTLNIIKPPRLRLPSYESYGETDKESEG